MRKHKFDDGGPVPPGGYTPAQADAITHQDYKAPSSEPTQVPSSDDITDKAMGKMDRINKHAKGGAVKPRWRRW
jgi:hypothetical protein